MNAHCRYCKLPPNKLPGICMDCWDLRQRWRLICRPIRKARMQQSLGRVMRPSGPVFVFKVDLVEDKALTKIKEKLKQINKV